MGALSIRPFASHPFPHPTSINSREESDTTVKIRKFSLQMHTFAPDPTKTYIPYSEYLAIFLYCHNFQSPQKSPQGRAL